MFAKIILGNTFPKRREIKGYGGIWSGEHKGWVIQDYNAVKAKAFCESNKFEMKEIEVKDDFFRPMTIDELRAYRQEKVNRIADKFYTKANRLALEAEALNAQTKPLMSDIAFVTQPITQNSGGRAFRKQRERIYGKVDKMFGLMNEAEDLRRKAESIINNVRVKGDAAQKRQEERDANDKLISVGTKIYDYSFGSGTVKKVNKKTYTIEYDRGFTTIQDKSHVKLA